MIIIKLTKVQTGMEELEDYSDFLLASTAANLLTDCGGNFLVTSKQEIISQQTRGKVFEKTKVRNVDNNDKHGLQND